MSRAHQNKLFDLWTSSLTSTNLPPPFKSSNHLLTTIDKIDFGEAPWKSFTLCPRVHTPNSSRTPIPSWKRNEYTIWYRDPLVVIRNILSTTAFACSFDPSPYKRYNSSGDRIYKDMMSGNWAWRQAVQMYHTYLLYQNDLFPQSMIAKDHSVAHGAMFVPVILGSDKTTVSVATGQNDYHPLYLSIGNIHNSLRRAHDSAITVVAFLAIPRGMHKLRTSKCTKVNLLVCKAEREYEGDPTWLRLRRQLFHTSLETILSSLRPGTTIPEVMLCPDGHYRRVIFGLGPYIADYPEQALLTLTIQGWCPRLVQLVNFFLFC
jgi:hypothetical protein